MAISRISRETTFYQSVHSNSAMLARPVLRGGSAVDTNHCTNAFPLGGDVSERLTDSRERVGERRSFHSPVTGGFLFVPDGLFGSGIPQLG